MNEHGDECGHQPDRIRKYLQYISLIGKNSRDVETHGLGEHSKHDTDAFASEQKRPFDQHHLEVYASIGLHPVP